MLDQSATPAELKAKLSKERKKWSLRLNAPDLAKRQDAEKKLALLDEASKIFESDESKANYDRQLSSDNQEQQEVYQQERKVQEEQGKTTLQIMEEYYRSNNYQVSAQMGQEQLSAGVVDLFLYEALADSYRRLNQVPSSLEICKQGLVQFPDSEYLYYLIVEGYLYNYEDLSTARQYLDNAVSKFPRNENLLKMDFECILREEGVGKKADLKANAYLAVNPSSEQLKAEIAEIYSVYSDTFLNFVGETGYIRDQYSYNQFARARKKASQYCGTSNLINFAKEAKNLGKHSFYKPGLKYPIGFFILTGLLSGFGTIGSLLAPLFLGFTALLLYCCWEPHWAGGARDIGGTDRTFQRAVEMVVWAFSFIIPPLKKLGGAAQAKLANR